MQLLQILVGNVWKIVQVYTYSQ